MIKMVRASGIAAAALTLVFAVVDADPARAEAAYTLSSTPFLDHASATIADEPSAPSQDSIAATVAGPAATLDHAIATNVADAIQFTDPVLPGPASLGTLVASYATAAVNDREQDCLAGAVYFEARSEPIEGQLAVAEVVINRTRSGRYPTGICAVVTQPAQFSFVRGGRLPQADRNSEAWRRAVAISRIALDRLASGVSRSVLWYHATYVSPSWGRRLRRESQIGLHIFYS